jgi:tRNA threonylcarbamoyladenosine biosynthesis protein TsaE
MDVTTCSLEEFNGVARRFVEGRVPHAERATVVTLSGELGAGKTTFVQAVAKVLGVAESVTSPTFVIEKVYKLEDQKFERLIHIDAYRLKGAQELGALGWRGLLGDSGALIVLEWPERVEDAIPEDAIRIRFDIHGDERTISINGQEKD